MDADQRTAVAAMWDGGRYDDLAPRLAPAAAVLAERTAGAPPGPVLDLAAGTGSVAVAVAASGRRVDAVDIAPGLVAAGRARTESLGLDVGWRVAPMDDLDAPAGSYAAVCSSFGLIFAADPLTTLRGVARVLMPGGVLAATVWHPEGYIASMSRRMASLLPEAAGSAVTAWIRWGEQAQAQDWCERVGLTGVRYDEQALPWRFDSAGAATDFLFAASPGHVAAARAVGERAPKLRRAVLDHLVDFAGTASEDAPIDLPARYAVVTATR